jgi:hypothetical protein
MWLPRCHGTSTRQLALVDDTAFDSTERCMSTILAAHSTASTFMTACGQTNCLRASERCECVGSVSEIRAMTDRVVYAICSF